MAPQKLIVFKHESNLGNAPAHKLFERITVTRTESVQAARQFSDYGVSINWEDLPKNVELIEKL